MGSAGRQLLWHLKKISEYSVHANSYSRQVNPIENTTAAFISSKLPHGHTRQCFGSTFLHVSGMTAISSSSLTNGHTRHGLMGIFLHVSAFPNIRRFIAERIVKIKHSSRFRRYSGNFLQQPTCGAAHDFTGFLALDRGVVTCAHFYRASPLRCASYGLEDVMIQLTSCMPLSCHTLSQSQSVRFMSNRVVKVNVRNGIARFDVGEAGIKKKYKQHNKEISDKTIRKQKKKEKKSKKAKKSELRFYRLKARKKLKSSNPEVRIKYKLEKAKRKEAWLIEKLLKYEIPKARFERHDPEPLTAEEKFYLKRTGQKQKNYVPVGVRGIFGGVILNMHLHWKRHETVKVICKPCKPGQIHQYADEIARLSGGIPIDLSLDNTIIFYRGKNYVQPEIMSPTDTLSKKKALEKFMFEQSLSSVKQFIAVLERELEDYQRHVAFYGKPGDPSSRTKSTANCEIDKPSLVKDYRGEVIVSHGRVNDCSSDRLIDSRHGCSLDVNNSCLVSTAESKEANSELDDLDMDSLKEEYLDSFSGSETEGGDYPT